MAAATADAAVPNGAAVEGAPEMPAAAARPPELPPLLLFDDCDGLGDLLQLPDAAAKTSPDQRSGAVKRRLTSWLPNMRGMLSTPSMPAIILIAIMSSLFVWRADVVRIMPQTASLFSAIGFPVNLRGLAFEDVRVVKELHDGMPVLVLEGRIANISQLTIAVPRIRFSLRNAAGHEVYHWASLPTQPTLGPSTELPFRTRLASPPAEGHEIAVRFFTHSDAVGEFL